MNTRVIDEIIKGIRPDAIKEVWLNQGDEDRYKTTQKLIQKQKEKYASQSKSR